MVDVSTQADFDALKAQVTQIQTDLTALTTKVNALATAQVPQAVKDALKVVGTYLASL